MSHHDKEWLETDGLGGFASGTASGVRTRRYHGLLVTATTPPTGRMMLVSGLDAWIESEGGRWGLSTQQYADGGLVGDGAQHIESFACAGIELSGLATTSSSRPAATRRAAAAGRGASQPGPPGLPGARQLASVNPWPTWIFRLPDGTRIVHEIFMRTGAAQVYLSWRRLNPQREGARTTLSVRPFLAGRDFHDLMHENPLFSFEPQRDDAQEEGVPRKSGDSAASQRSCLRYRPYPRGPDIEITSTGRYWHQPCWYRGFAYEEERRRGLDFVEDLASPGQWTFELADGEAVMVLSSGLPAGASPEPGAAARPPPGAPAPASEPMGARPGARRAIPAREAIDAARAVERDRRAALGGPLERAARQFVVRRPGGSSVMAGYPWFGEWGRDTFIAVRGLSLATGRVAEAIDVLSAWAGTVSEGMLPNFLADGTAPPAFNSVDASLWYIIAVGETIDAASGGQQLSSAKRGLFIEAIEAILVGYAAGTRYAIRGTDDGLLAAGVPGWPLTWMDARVGGAAVTPRIGKPVEIQALWLNALAIAARLETPSASRWAERFARGRENFERRFWDESRGHLYDVVDVGHEPGKLDPSLRPNQIFALGGLPLPLLTGDRAHRVLRVVQSRLLTPRGLRTLAPEEAGYHPRYGGGVEERDRAYHQGTVWPWLMGPFIEAHVRVHGGSMATKQGARESFLGQLLGQLGDLGLGHLSELADAGPPHSPAGCPFQAWSLGELLRVDRVVLAPDGR